MPAFLGGQKCLCKDWQDFDAEPTLDHYIKPRKLEIGNLIQGRCQDFARVNMVFFRKAWLFSVSGKR